MGKSGAVFAVRVGRKTGIFNTWDECKAQTNGYPGSSFKKCLKGHTEAQAWLDKFHQSAGNVFTSKPHSSTGSALSTRASATPYSIPNMASKITTGKHIAPVLDDDEVLAEAQSNAIVAYTDGASKNNQDAKSRIAGYGIHWAHRRPATAEGDIASRCPGEGQTNNIGELLAIIRTLELTKDDPRPLWIRSDSKYSIHCFDWIKNWKNNKWKKRDGSDIANVEMIRYMDALRRLRGVQGWEFKIQHVKGHANSAGNIAADGLANQGCLLPLDNSEPDWATLRRYVDTRIDQISLDKLHKKCAPAELLKTVKDEAAEATLITRPAVEAPPASLGEDDFSDIHLLSNAELLDEMEGA